MGQLTQLSRVLIGELEEGAVSPRTAAELRRALAILTNITEKLQAGPRRQDVEAARDNIGDLLREADLQDQQRFFAVYSELEMAIALVEDLHRQPLSTRS